MSYDLQLYTREPPDAGTLAELAAAVAVDDPVAVELEDLPEPVAGAILAPRSLVGLHVEGDQSQAAVAAAQRGARAVAERVGGALWDPQQDKVLWPRKAQRVPAIDRTDSRIRTITLQWSFARRLSAADGRSLLELLRVAAPEASPKRFGEFEPFQGQIARDGAEAFAALWDRGSLSWSSAAWPSAGGTATIWRDVGHRPIDPEDLAFIDHVDLTFDARAAEADPAWADALADLLTLGARRLDAFYAAGVVTGGVRVARTGALSYDAQSEHRVPVGRFWLGLPEFDPWLAWYGAELEDVAGVRGLVRLAVQPVDSDEAKALAPALPPGVRRGGDQLDAELRADRLPPVALT